jgi:hypothetical protein
MINDEQSDMAQAPSQKTPYESPAFCFERVFETSALSCGKIQSTQGACLTTRKNS